MTISEKVAYLKGLAEGLNIDTEKSKEGKLISVMIGILEEIGLSIEDMEEAVDSLGEEIDAMSDDLAEVEDIIFDEEDEDEDGCGCGCDDDFFETDCPSCGDVLMIDESILEVGSIQCPSCKETFSIDFTDCGEEEEGADSCGCGCGCEDHEA